MHPVLLRVGEITFYTYGLMVGLGYIAGVFVAARRMEKKDLDPDSFFGFFLFLLIGGVLGGRLLHIALNTWYYQNWRSLIDPQGGLAMHGVLVGGVSAMAIYSRVKKVSFLKLGDIIAPSIVLGQAIGRIGCFLNGCCYGVPTSGSWGVLTRYAPGLRHPYQLYESAADFALFLGLLWVSSRIELEGGLFLLYLGGYSTLRFFLEFFRENESYFWGLSYGQWVSLGLAVLCASIYLSARRRLHARKKAAAENEEAARQE